MPLFSAPRTRRRLSARVPRAFAGVVLGSVLGLGVLWLVAWLVGM